MFYYRIIVCIDSFSPDKSTWVVQSRQTKVNMTANHTTAYIKYIKKKVVKRQVSAAAKEKVSHYILGNLAGNKL